MDDSVCILKFRFKGKLTPLETALEYIRTKFPAAETEESSTSQELATILSSFTSGLILASIRSQEDVEELTTFVKKDSKIAGKVKQSILAIDFTKDQAILKTLRKIGINNITEAETSEKALKVKLDFLISSFKEKNEGKKAVEKSNAQKSTSSDRIRWKEPLNLEEDYWLIDNGQFVKNILSNWVVSVIGPSSEAGRWVKTKNGLWTFEFKDKEGPFSSPSNVTWVLWSAKPPEHIFEKKMWVLRGQNLELFCERAGSRFYKIRADVNSIEIAKNSSWGEEKRPLIEKSYESKHVFKTETVEGSDSEISIEDSNADELSITLDATASTDLVSKGEAENEQKAAEAKKLTKEVPKNPKEDPFKKAKEELQKNSKEDPLKKGKEDPLKDPKKDPLKTSNQDPLAERKSPESKKANDLQDKSDKKHPSGTLKKDNSGSLDDDDFEEKADSAKANKKGLLQPQPRPKEWGSKLNGSDNSGLIDDASAEELDKASEEKASKKTPAQKSGLFAEKKDNSAVSDERSEKERPAGRAPDKKLPPKKTNSALIDDSSADDLVDEEDDEDSSHPSLRGKSLAKNQTSPDPKRPAEKKGPKAPVKRATSASRAFDDSSVDEDEDDIGSGLIDDSIAEEIEKKSVQKKDRKLTKKTLNDQDDDSDSDEESDGTGKDKKSRPRPSVKSRKNDGSESADYDDVDFEEEDEEDDDEGRLRKKIEQEERKSNRAKNIADRLKTYYTNRKAEKNDRRLLKREKDSINRDLIPYTPVQARGTIQVDDLLRDCDFYDYFDNTLIISTAEEKEKLSESVTVYLVFTVDNRFHDVSVTGIVEKIEGTELEKFWVLSLDSDNCFKLETVMKKWELTQKSLEDVFMAFSTHLPRDG
jgi:hypothetical protein